MFETFEYPTINGAFGRNRQKKLNLKMKALSKCVDGDTLNTTRCHSHKTWRKGEYGNMKTTKKFLVNIYNVETKDGYGAFEKWENGTDQTPFNSEMFDTFEEAKKAYEERHAGMRQMSGYYLHTCKALEMNEYDEGGEWVGGGDWYAYEFPDFDTIQRD